MEGSEQSCSLITALLPSTAALMGAHTGTSEGRGKAFSRKHPQFVSQAVARFICPKEETTLKYEKCFWEDDITHKENFFVECVLYSTECRKKSSYGHMIPLTSITCPV